VKLFPAYASFSNVTVTGFSGSYNFATKALNLAATSVHFKFGEVDFTSGAVTLGLDPVAGTFSIDAIGASITVGTNVFLNGTFSVRTYRNVNVKFSDANTDQSSLVTIGGAGVQAFVGSGGPASNSGAVGFTVSSLNFGVALITP